MQTPPMYSAIKRGGVPLYKLAREGVEVEREARPISIHHLSLHRDDVAALRFAVQCSKGTYVRVLAEDLGRALGTVAHLATLRRTGFGAFRLGQGAVDADSWDPDSGAGLLSIREALSEVPAISVPERAESAVLQGQIWALKEYAPRSADSPSRVLLLGVSGHPLALIERKEGKWRFARVLGNR